LRAKAKDCILCYIILYKPASVRQDANIDAGQGRQAGSASWPGASLQPRGRGRRLRRGNSKAGGRAGGSQSVYGNSTAEPWKQYYGDEGWRGRGWTGDGLRRMDSRSFVRAVIQLLYG
jgi:hypothetical protein